MIEGSTPRALALGATLAFGSCTIGVGCAEEAPSAPVTPVALEAAPVEHVEPEPPPATELDLAAAEGALGTHELAPGFVPDPLHIAGERSGGASVDAHRHDDRCVGWVTGRPDAIISATRPFAELTVMAASEHDTSLVVVGPDGEARCSDDEDGMHPLVRGAFEQGMHRVWVGVSDPDVSAHYVLALSELVETQPSQLPL